MKNSRPLPAKKTISCFKSNDTQRSNQLPRQQNRQSQKVESTKNEPPSSDKNKDNKIKADKDIVPICDICAQDIPGPERQNIFAFGRCDHHVCYVCSARLRAICDQFECPICREKLDNVIFSANKDIPFDKHNLSSLIHNTKYGIYFESDTIQDTFNKLMRYYCIKCHNEDPVQGSSRKRQELGVDKDEFSDISRLKQHLYMAHKLRLCDLCLAHNKLFPFEYSYYDIASLRRHQKDGEPNTSHRGHPDCILCRNTFFNQDELLQHMSREHYHCHLCGRHNSTMHIYFLDYASLRLHFKAEHFLCERGNCKHEQFTSAFDSQIDYQLHIVHVHGGSANASRGETRQQCTITLDSVPHRQSTSRHRSGPPHNGAVISTGTPAIANSSDPRRQIPESIRSQIRQQRLPTGSDFPTLSNETSSPTTNTPAFQSVTVSSTSQTSGSNFPQLAQNNPSQRSRTVALSYRITAGPSSSRGAFNRTAGGGTGLSAQMDQKDFPPLPERPKAKKSKVPSDRQKTTNRDQNLTLDQLINNNLVLSARKNNIKTSKPNKNGKSSKQRLLKFEL